MKNWCANTSIKKKLFIAFAIIVSLTGLMTLISVSGQFKVRNVVTDLFNVELRKQKLALNSVASIFRARNYEKDYLLHATTLGFDEARSILATGVENETNAIRSNLEEIISLSPEGLGVENEQRGITLASAYINKFMSSVDLIEKKGFNDYGIEGDFRKKVHDIEDAINTEELDGLKVTMLMIRRHEKDYLMRGSQKYIDSVSTRVGQLISEVESSGIADTQKANINALAGEYLTLFNQLVAINGEIEQLKNDYQQDVSQLEPILNTIYSDTLIAWENANTEMAGSMLFSMLFVCALGVLMIAVGIAVAYVLSRYLVTSINRLAEVAGNIAEGDLDQNIHIYGKDEIGRMSETFRDMIEYMQKMAAAAQTLSLGDTRVKISPKSERDVLGNAFVKMITYQNRMCSIAERLACGDIKITGQNIYEHDSLGQAFRNLNFSLENALSNDIKKIVDSACSGDLSQRIDLIGKEGFYYDLSKAINNLVDVNESIINDTINVTSAMSNGDLTESMNTNYTGSFATLSNDVTSMQVKLRKVIENDIEKIVSAAAHGDLSQRIELSDKQGFYRTLANSINNVIDQSSQIIGDCSTVIAALAKGDLTKQISREYEGEFNQLKTDINRTVEQLTSTVLEIKESTEKVRAGAAEITIGNNSLSERTESQAAALEETTAAMGGINLTIDETNTNTLEANRLAKDASLTAEKGREIVANAVSAVRDIDNSSTEMAGIISVIDEIAFQTNLLALNASVEAARAGDQGKGFAVVATEVRTLAGRSAEAASQIKHLIEGSIKKVAEGTKSVINSGEVLEEIVGSIDKVTSIVGEISTSISSQSTSIAEVSKAVADMDNMTQQNAALVEESAAASETLGNQAQVLDELINFFSTNTESGYNTVVNFPKKTKQYSLG